MKKVVLVKIGPLAKFGIESGQRTLQFKKKDYDFKNAIDRENQLKGWRREKKEKLISTFNSAWKFLNNEV